MLNPEITAKLAECDRLHAACSSGEWLVEGSTVYSLVHRGWRKGVEEFTNYVSLWVNISKNYRENELEREQTASCIAALHNAYPAIRQHIADQAARIAELENHIELMRLALAKREADPMTFTTGGNYGPR